ncbi:PAS domain S-box-containing protein [Tissierella praeacuta DSM 18095]|uniref:PAS domain S-box-containing protein n=1 Tax=Tissierella praeacuta DSM 18095 TaxID=1123404 RepID=A0A1M4WVI2_9FIRM|nr:sigma 54-interacting transcriptional regulator [Tissierella praeacuta]SHE85236.1 PAS domain S-box-containing protein [Tissierella praeacuta DSM 18095]SUP00428.1 Nitrogen assimilation regulatory protein [Tissierella praeacuta]
MTKNSFTKDIPFVVKNNGLKDCQNAYEDLMEEFNAILDASNDGIHITDGKGVTLRFNKSCERIDGVKADYVIGKHMEELVAEGIYSESVALAVIKEKKQISMLQQVNGKEVIGTGTPIFKNGELYRIVINSRDITELRDLKRSLEEAKLINKKYQQELDIISSKDKAKNNNIIYNSEKMDKIIDLALRVAKVDSTVLIEGESGVGKGVLSCFLHNNSLRYNKPFIKINCGAIPENLLESELFGYEKGSFTGANKEGKVGLIQLADKGTLFLDEIGELPLNLQVKLLNVIQNRELTKVGGTNIIPVDIRIIAATNRNLQDMIKNKTFREDLYYRLNVVPITIPPLRERKEDIPPLILNFLNRFNEKYNYNKKISPEAMKILLRYNWSGNIREVENLIERLVVTTNDDIINKQDIIDCQLVSITDYSSFDINKISSYKNIIAEYEKKLLLDIMSKCKSTHEMAEILNLDRSTIRKKFKRLNIKLEFKEE